HDKFVYKGKYTYENIGAYTEVLLKKNKRPTAFLVATDQMAIAVLDAAMRTNIDVPNELSVIGFDNISIASNPYISLTTVTQHIEKMAFLAIQELVNIIEGNNKNNKQVRITLEPQLIIRNTTAN